MSGQQFQHIKELWTDTDGTWIRTAYGELAGPFASEAEAREQFAPCPRCDGYGLTGDDPSGQNLATCTLCDESGLKYPE